jgi:hypothetical protein
MRGFWPVTWVTIDGNRVPIVDKWAKPTFALAMVLVLSSLAAGGATAGATAAGTAAESAVSQNITVRANQGKRSARQGRHNEAWLRMGLRVINRQVRTDRDCTAHATGQVRTCLKQEPCVGLQRSLVTLRDEHGNTLKVSVAWVRMPSWTSARHFQRLIDTSGTGGIAPLEAGVRLTGRHYASQRSGTVVVTAEAVTGSGQPTAELLDAVAEVAAEFPWSEG